MIKYDERWHLIFIESASIERRDMMMKWKWNLFMILLLSSVIISIKYEMLHKMTIPTSLRAQGGVD